MSEADTQAVVDETKAAPEVPAAVDDARKEPSLDELLKEFNETAKPEPKPEQTQQPSAPAVDNDLRREVAELKFKMEFEPTLNRVRGDIPKDIISDEELTDLIDGRAKRDPKLQQAWINRAQNPRAWAQIEKALNAELSKKFQPRVDQNATADKEAVAAAVRAASTKAPEEKPPDYGSMSSSEFEAEKRKYGL